MPAQTGEQLIRALEVYGRKGGTTFRVASTPELLREGTAVGDFFHPDRIVVGGEDEETERQLREIYKPLISPWRNHAFLSDEICIGDSGGFDDG